VDFITTAQKVILPLQNLGLTGAWLGHQPTVTWNGVEELLKQWGWDFFPTALDNEIPVINENPTAKGRIPLIYPSNL